MLAAVQAGALVVGGVGLVLPGLTSTFPSLPSPPAPQPSSPRFVRPGGGEGAEGGGQEGQCQPQTSQPPTVERWVGLENGKW